MSDLRTVLTVGLIISMAVIGGSLFYTETATQYGVSGTDLTGVNITADIVQDLETSQEDLLGTLNNPTIYGVFESALTGAGTVVNMFLNSFSMFTEMIQTFINSIVGNNVFSQYIVLTLYGLIVLTIVIIVLRVIFGGRI